MCLHLYLSYGQPWLFIVTSTVQHMCEHQFLDSVMWTMHFKGKCAFGLDLLAKICLDIK